MGSALSIEPVYGKVSAPAAGRRWTHRTETCWQSSPIARLLDELGRFVEGHARELSVADFSDSEGAIRIIEEFPLDVFTILRGMRYADLVEATKTTPIDDVDVNYLNAQALIAQE